MDLRQLRYFVTVADEKSISAAAKKLYLSQPPLSTQLHQLETELGCVLFERGARRIQLTQAGRMLYERATVLLQMADSTRQALRDYTDGTSGTLRFGAVSSVCGTVLADWMASFCAEVPSARFELKEGNTYQLLEQVRLHQIELAVVRTPFTAEGMEQVALPAEPMLAVAHSAYFAAIPGERITLAQLAACPLIVYRRWEPVLQELFDTEQLHPTFFCKNDDARTTALWADAGLGVGLIPQSSRALLHNSKTICREVADSRLRTGIVLVRSRDTYLSTLASHFIAHVRAQAPCAAHSDTIHVQ